MSTRQYIGARYVPKFFDDGKGSSEWVSGLAYEPLTVVTHLGNSFTSKKPVPVGVDILDTEYWCVTGNYNEQVESYRQEVSNLRTYVNSKRNKKRVIICVYDSLGDGYNSATDVRHGWFYWLKQLHPEFTVIGANYPGAGLPGFTSGINNKSFFVSLSEGVTLPDNIDATDVTDIWVAGGTNDFWNGDETLFDTNLKEFMDYAKATYPYASVKLAVFCSPNYALAPNQTKWKGGIEAFYSRIKKYGGEFIANTSRMLCDNSKFGVQESGLDVHLTNDGYEFYSPYLINAFLSGSGDYHFVFNTNGTNVITAQSVIDIDDYPIFTYDVYPDHYVIQIGSTVQPGEFCVASANVTTGAMSIIDVIMDNSGTVRIAPLERKGSIFPLLSSNRQPDYTTDGYGYLSILPANRDVARVDYRVFVQSSKTGLKWLAMFAEKIIC